MIKANWKIKVKTTPIGEQEFYPMVRMLFIWYYIENPGSNAPSLSIFPATTTTCETLEAAKNVIFFLKERLNNVYGSKVKDIIL